MCVYVHVWVHGTQFSIDCCYNVFSVTFLLSMYGLPPGCMDKGRNIEEDKDQAFTYLCELRELLKVSELRSASLAKTAKAPGESLAQ